MTCSRSWGAAWLGFPPGAAHCYSTRTSDALFEMGSGSLRINKTLIKLLGDNFGSKMQPNDSENVFKQVSFFIREKMMHLFNFYHSLFSLLELFHS